MDRQEFLKNGILLSIGAVTIPSIVGCSTTKGSASQPLFINEMTERRFNLPQICISIKVSSSETDGAFAVFEEITNSGAGTPLHTHKEQWEMLEVIEGKYKIKINEKEFVAEVGCIAIIPPKTSHAFINISPSTSKLRFILSPGLGFEKFVEEMSKFDELPPINILKELLNKYGMELMGQPLNM